ncbi:hypothetical protein GCM10009557_09130 [Virgisporangium ochraceum]
MCGNGQWRRRSVRAKMSALPMRAPSPPILQLWPPSKHDIYANRGGHKCKIGARVDNGAGASGAAGQPFRNKG